MKYINLLEFLMEQKEQIKENTSSTCASNIASKPSVLNIGSRFQPNKETWKKSFQEINKEIVEE